MCRWRSRECARPPGICWASMIFPASAPPNARPRPPVKTLTRLDIDADGDTLTFSLEADAFLHHMVRNLVGALLVVGKGKQPPAWMAELLAARNRRIAPPTFMPDGLYLTGVRYPANLTCPRRCRYMARADRLDNKAFLMSTTKKGNEFEAIVHDVLREQIVTAGLFGMPELCKLRKKPKYYSRDRQGDIIFDLSIEVYFPGQKKFYFSCYSGMQELFA